MRESPLADILSDCFNTSGRDGTCAALFSAATPVGGAASTDIVGVNFNVAANPASSGEPGLRQDAAIAALPAGLVTARGAFTGLASPAGIALDAVGNVWCACDSGNSGAELSRTGAVLSGSEATQAATTSSAHRPSPSTWPAMSGLRTRCSALSSNSR